MEWKFLHIEKKLGIDITKKIFKFYMDFVFRELTKKNKIRDYYYTKDDCTFVLYYKKGFRNLDLSDIKYMFVSSFVYMNQFYRKNSKSMYQFF